MKLVSIIICCYNGSKFLEQCFQCVLKQSYKCIEVIFVDDGSTDDSFSKSLSYQNLFVEQGMVLKCLTQENKGAGGAAAYGLKEAKGDYICCYDVDDLLFPQSIEKRVAFLESHPDFDIVRTNGYRTIENPNGSKNRSLFVKEKEEKEEENIFVPLLFGRTNNWSGSYMVRSAVLWKVYPNHHIIESRYGQNLQILLAVSYQHKSGFVDEPLMEYLYNPQSFTNKNKSFANEISNLKGYYSIRKAILKQLLVYDKELLDKLETFYLQQYLDLCLHFDKSEDFINYFKELKLVTSPLTIYKYHYHRFKGNRIMALWYRALNYLSRFYK